MAPRYTAPKGTFDVLGPSSARYAALVATFAEHAGRAGYDLLVQPMFEDVEVFQRLGDSTDVVRKEMYDFTDKGGRHLALRPEGTASAARAFLEHHPTHAVEGLVRRAPSSATTARRRAGTASTTRWGSRRSARTTLTSTWR